jgi:molybdenum cofactor biosynthesis protein B
MDFADNRFLGWQQKEAVAMGSGAHRKKLNRRVRVGVLSMSTTRTLAEDKSGQWIAKALKKDGHEIICHRLLPDDRQVIAETVVSVTGQYRPDALLLTGGTGISPRDVTIEAVGPLFDKEMSAFGVLFAQLSFEEIDSAALLSRSAAGIIGSTAVFCMPGSLNACKLALNALILPELVHLVNHMTEA